jgi:hypothetical protein
VNWSYLRRDGTPGVAAAPRVAPRLADDFLDSYIDWREECAAVSGAYRLWQRAERGDEAMAFAAYHAALDREEHAAGLFRECTERISLHERA